MHACHIAARLSISRNAHLSGTLPNLRSWRTGVAQLTLTGPSQLSGTLPTTIAHLHRATLAYNPRLSG
jgi:hypothetical protein